MTVTVGVLASMQSVVERHGRARIDSALGEDAPQLATLYSTLKALVEDNKPDATVADLPSALAADRRSTK